MRSRANSTRNSKGEFVNKVQALIVAVFCFLFSSLLLADLALEQGSVAEDGPTKIYCQMAILDLDQINDADQNFSASLFVSCRWNDPREAHEGPGKITKNLNEAWHPSLFFLNPQRIWQQLPDSLDISPSGDVVQRQKVWGDFSQPLNLRDFPLDTQTLEITLVAARSDDFADIELLQDPESPSFLAERFSVADWKIIDSGVRAEPLVLPTGEKAEAFAFVFTAQRLTNYYLVKFIAPLLMILVLSWVVFWIDPTEGGAQLGVAVTTCLTVIAYHLSLSSRLPKIAYLTHLDVFVFGATLLVFLAMIEVVTTTGLARSGRVDTARRLDRTSRLLFPSALALVGLYSFAWR